MMFRKLILASAVSLALAPAGAGALGLGGIRTQSALYEPFVGEIDLKDIKPEDLDTLKVGLASDAEFSKAGAVYSNSLARLRFKPQVSPEGRPIIRVTSRDPIREPYLDFLIEVNSSQGRLVKEYTVLLDPPTTIKRSPPRVQAPVVREAARPRQVQPAAKPAVAEATRPVANTPAHGNEAGFPLRYGPVEPGAGLWRVARALAPAGATVAQTAMAIYRTNQGAFIRGDINNLKVGEVLTIPSSAELFALDAASAEREFGAALAGRKATSAPLAPAVAAEPSADRLKIAEAGARPAGAQGDPPSQPEGQSGGKLGSLKDELLLVRETSESTRQETDELRGRIRELESQLADIRQLLDLRNEQLAQLKAVSARQPQVAAAEETALLPAKGAGKPSGETPTADVGPSGPLSAEATDVPPTDAGAAAAAAAAATEPSRGPEAKDDDPHQAAVTKVAAEQAKLPAEITVAGEPQDSAKLPATADAEALEGPRLAQVTPAVTDKLMESAPKPVAARPVRAADDSLAPAFWESLPMPTTAIAFGIPAILLPLGWLMMRRRRQMEEEFAASQLSTVAVPRTAGAPASVAPDASYENDSEDAAATVDSPYSSFDDLDEETGQTDVASEADVYIAYGRYREAEYLLEEELSKSPERLDLKFKLAEAYFGAKNAEGLARLKDEIKRAGGDRLHEDKWRRLTSMLRDLEGMAPDEPAAHLTTDEEDEAKTLPLEATPTKQAPLTASQLTAGSPASEPSGSDYLDLSLMSERPSGADRAADRPDGGALELELDDLAGFDFDLEAVARENEVAMARGGDVAVARSELGPIDGPELDWPEELDGQAESADAGVIAKDSKAEGSGAPLQTDSTLWDEVSTKIDLARAYMDMADPDAARAILEEVGEEGNEAQRAEAKEMLSQLA
jgi:pilus assembly protein FimV